MKYYEIRRIKDRRNTVFDTIDYVAYRAGLSEPEILIELGARDRAELLKISHLYLTHPRYNFETYLTNRLNQVCRNYCVPLRIIRDIHGKGWR